MKHGNDQKLIDEMRVESARAQTRRHFLRTCTTGLGGMFFASLGAGHLGARELDFTRSPTAPLEPLPPQYPGKVKRVIYLHMAGAPSQLELFEHKPDLTDLDGEDCPPSFLEGKRFAFITGVPQMLGSQFPFHRAGKSGAWISDRLPHFERHIDDVAFIRSMRTDQFNHAPAQLYMLTGTPRVGNPSLGSWVTYGLGTENQNLPGYIVLVSGGKDPDGGKGLWHSGFLPSVYQGVQCRSKGDPVLYLSNPPGVSRDVRRSVLDAIGDINRKTYEEVGDPETITRIAQYEMAFRMQLDATDAMDISRESRRTLEAYGAEPGAESFANNCLVARRLAERGVRFIQLYDWGWDTHGNSAKGDLKDGFVEKCKQIDRPIGALLDDLKNTGLIEDTLIVWGGEFGRTPMQENRGGKKMEFTGRDHHPGAFTIWMTGGGVKGGVSYGETDAVGYDVVRNPVEVRDLHATLLKMMGFDHESLTYRYQGLDQKLTGVQEAHVIHDVLA